MAPRMPESESKPRLIELVDPGAGQGWKAVLKNGKAVVVHEIPVPAAEAAGAVPRIQRLFEHRHPALSPVLAWGTDPNGLWVAVEPNEGVPLGTILSRGPLTPPAAAALGASLLSGVAALHEAGIAMGGFGAASVRITGNGEVRLAGHPAGAVRGAPSQSDLRADVRSSGMAICAAFGVDPAGAPAPPNIPPGLVVTMRSMASGAMGPAADRAQGALREMASALLAPDRMTAAQAELALRSGGREMSVTPFLPETEAPAPAPAPPAPYVPPAPREETPLPRAAASYDAPPRAPETKPPGPPIPSAYAPYTPPAPAAPTSPPVTFPPVPIVPPAPEPPAPTPPSAFGTSAPAPSPFATNTPAPTTPAPAPLPYATSAPTPAPFGTNVPAAPTWDIPDTASTPKEIPVVPAPYEPPAPRYETIVPTAAPTTPPAPEQTWTPIATPAWTPNDAPAVPAVAAIAETAAPAIPPPTLARKPSVVRPAYREPSERPAWLLPAIAAIAILLLLGVGGGIFLASRGGSSKHTAVTSPKTSPKVTPKTSPKVTPRPSGIAAVPTYAPTASAPLTSVQFCTPQAPCKGGTTQDTNCQLNGPCHVDIGIYWANVSLPSLTYSIEFFDRCTGQSKTVFKQTRTPPSINRSFIPAPPGGFALTLPSAKVAALVAVAQTGAASAASLPPYYLPGSAASCS